MSLFNKLPHETPAALVRALAFVAGAFAVVVMATPAVARAESPFDGKWKQGALHEEYTVQQWLPGCGPAPVSGNAGGGEIVSVREEGDELSIVGGGRVYKSNQCYDPLPTLARDSHSRDSGGRTWRTRCSTPAADPRRALMQTLVAATSDTHIDVIETGRYEITLNEGRCIADVKRSRGFDLVSRDGVPTTPSASAPPPAPTPAPVPTPTPRQACSPGDPARLEVRPSRKLMRPGESFTFRALVTDASGCPTPTTTSWALGDPEGARSLKLEPNGKVTALDGAEGATDLVATAADKSVHVTVEVASAARYDDLLTKQGLNAAGENDAAATAVIAGSSIGGADAKGEDGARKRKTIFVGIVGALVVILGILALVYSRRAKKAAVIEKESEDRHHELVREAEDRKRAKLEAHASQQRAHEESILRVKRAAESSVGTMLCPTCKREFPPPAGNFCPQDATRLVPLADADESTLAPAGGVCPICRRGFQPGVKVCPTDKEELLPYAAVAATATVSAKGKICPTCGDRFDGGAGFCGKDGTALVLLN